MDRLFLDANVLFSAAYKRDAHVFRLWKLEGVFLCSSRYALEEARFNLAEANQRQRLMDLSEKLQFYEARERALPSGISLPEKDAPILLAAIDARANYLVTGDLTRFGRYFDQRVEGVVIVSPARYFKIRSEAK